MINCKQFLFGIFFLLAIIITGERSNGIKAILGFLLFILFYKKINLKYKITFFISFIIIIVFFVSNSSIRGLATKSEL